jgi:predicted nucleotidyltransferase
MATIHLPPDFKEFLQLLNKHGVEYLIIGGYAVGYYGYPRATGDMDVWIAFRPGNTRSLVAALREFGFAVPEPPEEFLQEGQFVGIGNQPLRIEILTSISGVHFSECYAERNEVEIDGVPVAFIGLQHLKTNKSLSE